MIRKSVTFLIIFVLTVAVVQMGAAIYFSNRPAISPDADLLVIFPGGGKDSKRISAGTNLAREGKTNAWTIISHSEKQLANYARKNNIPKNVVPAVTGKSRSTFEDVYETFKIIEKNNIHSVMLVSSAYHIPRGLGLLVMYLKLNGMNVKVYAYPVHEKMEKKEAFKIYYNETIKFWGSLVEMAGCLFTGTTVLDIPFVMKIRNYLKNALIIQKV